MKIDINLSEAAGWAFVVFCITVVVQGTTFMFYHYADEPVHYYISEEYKKEADLMYTRVFQMSTGTGSITDWAHEQAVDAIHSAYGTPYRIKNEEIEELEKQPDYVPPSESPDSE